MTTQLAFSHCPFTELHSAPNDGKGSNHPSRLLCRAGRAGKVLQRDQQHLCSLRLGKGGKTAQAFFFFKHEPHISQRGNPSSSSSLEAGSGVLSQAEQHKKGVKAKPALGECHKPPGVAGGGGLGSATSWKAGREMKSPVSWCSYCKHSL